MARRVNNNCGGVTPLDARYVSRSEDTERQDPINAANELPFLITASELRDRKTKRRRKQDDLPGRSEAISRLVEIGLSATPRASPTERLKAARDSVSAGLKVKK